jgi:hypothetical protein
MTGASRAAQCTLVPDASKTLRRLTERARREGVTRFTAPMLAENHEMLGLLKKLGGFAVRSRVSGVIEVEGQIGPGET